MRRRVVITGLGVVSPLGVGVGAFWEGLVAGKSGLSRITRFDPSGFPCRLAGEIRNLSAKDYVPKNYRKAVKVMARDTELAVAAAKLAVDDAGLITRGNLPEGASVSTIPGERFGCQIGAGLIAAETDELAAALVTAVQPDSPHDLKRRTAGFDIRKWGNAQGGGGGINNLPPLWMLKYLPNMLACHVTIIHGAEGPSNTITCAEASGLLSLGESFRIIMRGAADACFSGGAESKINLLGMLRLDMAGRLAATAHEPDGSHVVRPYDPLAPGGVAGEAGGILILEEHDAAAKRGARVYAEIKGFGAGQSIPPISPVLGTTSVSGDGLELAIRAALRDAGASPDSIDAIVPQGAGVPACDAAEAAALRAVFGARAAAIPLVTVTPNVGDSSAGNGGLLAAAGAMCLKSQMLPARLHHGHAMGLTAGAHAAEPARLNRVLVCSAGMGGQNAALVLDALT